MKISSWIQSSTPPQQLLKPLPNQLPSGVLFLFLNNLSLIFWVLFVCFCMLPICKWLSGNSLKHREYTPKENNLLF